VRAASLLTLTAGYLYGPILGTAIVSVAATLGATLAFFVSRYVARPLVLDRIGSNPRFQQISANVERKGTLASRHRFVLQSYKLTMERRSMLAALQPLTQSAALANLTLGCCVDGSAPPPVAPGPLRAAELHARAHRHTRAVLHSVQLAGNVAWCACILLSAVSPIRILSSCVCLIILACMPETTGTLAYVYLGSIGQAAQSGLSPAKLTLYIIGGIATLGASKVIADIAGQQLREDDSSPEQAPLRQGDDDDQRL